MAGKKNYEKGAKDLICSQTGFKTEEDVNFGICLQYVMSNFRFHRFLDPDSHKIQRELDGIHEKFSIHSENKRAALFKESVDQFLESQSEKKEVGYAVLSLLLHLAGSPTTNTFVDIKGTANQEEAGESFDWANYLLEGEELYKHVVFPESPDWSEEESTEEDAINDSGLEVQTFQQATSVSDVTTMDEHNVLDSGEAWLARNVVIQYWQGRHDPTAHTQAYSAGLWHHWERYACETNAIYTNQASVLVTESHIVREILWMLAGTPELYIFYRKDDHYVVKKDVYLSHMTSSTLLNSLKMFCCHGDIILSLQTFIEEVTSQNTLNEHGKLSVCQTYQAYAASLSSYLHSLRTELTHLERRAIKQDESLTLSQLYSELQPHLSELSLLQRVHSEGVLASQHLDSWSFKASRLLTVLYDAVLEADMFGEFSSHVVMMLLRLWLHTSKPYIDIIDEWITDGKLVDPAKEFIIHRNDISLDETFWETAFTLHVTNVPDQTMVESDSYVKSSWAPAFLRPILTKIILAGKSMELMQNLGRLGHVVNKQGGHRETLYTMFKRGFLSDDNTTSQSDNVLVETAPSTELDMLPGDVKQYMFVKGVSDPLMRQNFSQLLQQSKSRSQQRVDNNGEVPQTGTVPPVKSIQILMQTCLYPEVTSKYRTACSSLLEVLKTEYHLLDYFTSVRSYFLMDAGDTMFDFYSEIFEKLRVGEDWRDISFLNLTLQDAVRKINHTDCERLFVSIDNDDQSGHSKRHPIQALDDLKLHYKVPWPVDVVINSSCQRVYNKIFTFILQVKRAKFGLDELRFSDLERQCSSDETFTVDMLRTRSDVAHRMHLFRMRLMHFVNSLHVYIMTRILHSTGLTFQKEIQDAEDLDQVISIHNQYITTIHERCLLHKKVAFLKEAVIKVLNLVISFQEYWSKGVDNISTKALTELDSEFSRCIHFLSSFLNNVIKRGSFPHLESLAFSLITSSEQMKR